MLRLGLMAEGRDARYIMCTSVRILLAWQQFRHVQAVWQVLPLRLNLPPSPCQTEGTSFIAIICQHQRSSFQWNQKEQNEKIT